MADAAFIRAQFAAAKKSKGIVYYNDRMEQLAEQSHLIMGTPSPVPMKKIKIEGGVVEAVSLIEDLNEKEEKKGTKRRRKESAVVSAEAITAKKRKSAPKITTETCNSVKVSVDRSKVVVKTEKRVTTRSTGAKKK